jgi:hypothetical protein
MPLSVFQLFVDEGCDEVRIRGLRRSCIVAPGITGRRVGLWCLMMMNSTAQGAGEDIPDIILLGP